MDNSIPFVVTLHTHRIGDAFPSLVAAFVDVVHHMNRSGRECMQLFDRGTWSDAQTDAWWLAIRFVEHDHQGDVDVAACAICLDVLGCDAVTTACGHRFCAQCLRRHVDASAPKSGVCPLCRRPLSCSSLVRGACAGIVCAYPWCIQHCPYAASGCTAPTFEGVSEVLCTCMQERRRGPGAVRHVRCTLLVAHCTRDRALPLLALSLRPLGHRTDLALSACLSRLLVRGGRQAMRMACRSCCGCAACDPSWYSRCVCSPRQHHDSAPTLSTRSSGSTRCSECSV